MAWSEIGFGKFSMHLPKFLSAPIYKNSYFNIFFEVYNSKIKIDFQITIKKFGLNLNCIIYKFKNNFFSLKIILHNSKIIF